MPVAALMRLKASSSSGRVLLPERVLPVPVLALLPTNAYVKVNRRSRSSLVPAAQEASTQSRESPKLDHLGLELVLLPSISLLTAYSN